MGNRVLWCSAALLSMVLLMTITGCDRSRVIEIYKPVGFNGWDKDSLARFNFEINDTTSVYNFYINTRNQNNYPYSNLWLFVDIVAPDQSVLRDTFEVQMARADGKWLGKGFGSIFDLQTPYRKKIYFPVSGTYTIIFQQGMRDLTLPGVHDIGLRIEKL